MILRYYDLRQKNVNLCNRLPEQVISSNNVTTFKNCLDKFWANQAIKCNYKDQFARIGRPNKSLVKQEDICT